MKMTVDKERMGTLLKYRLILWRGDKVVVNPAVEKIWNSGRIHIKTKVKLQEYKNEYKGSYHRAIYHFAYNLNHRPRCHECGKHLQFLNFVKGYKEDCKHTNRYTGDTWKGW